MARITPAKTGPATAKARHSWATTIATAAEFPGTRRIRREDAARTLSWAPAARDCFTVSRSRVTDRLRAPERAATVDIHSYVVMSISGSWLKWRVTPMLVTVRPTANS